jgi:hypothetical protein
MAKGNRANLERLLRSAWERQIALRAAKTFTKAKSEKDIQPTKAKPHSPPGKQYFSRAISTAKVFWSVIAIGLALLGGWKVLRPVVHVDPYIQLDPTSPFSERFKVSNDGFFSIYDVQVRCIILNAAVTRGGGVENTTVTNYGIDRKVLEAADSTTVDCALDRFVRFPIDKYVSADIEIVISFKPSWYPWHKQKTARFSGQLDTQGNVRWVYGT